MAETKREALQVVRVEVENVLGIESAAIDVGAVTRVFGENGTGKTSLHRALEAGFKGGAAEIIRLGADQARVLVRLRGAAGDVTVERKIGRGAGVTVKRGAVPQAKPQTFLDGILGDLSFDPGAFATMKPAQQVEMFTAAFPCRIAGDALEAARAYGIDTERHGLEVLNSLAAALTERRRAIGVNNRERAAVLESRRPASLDVEEDPIAEETAVGDLEAARILEAQARDRQAAIESHNGHVRALDRSIADKREQIRRLELDLEQLERQRDRVPAAPEPIDPTTARAAIETARAAGAEVQRANAEARRVAAWKRDAEALEDAKREHAELDRLVKATREDWLRELFRQIDLPLEGVALEVVNGEPNITVGGVPLKTANTARQIHVGMRIAAALNRDYPVRVVAIDEAEHLTSDSRAVLEAEAEAAGFQVLMFIAASRRDVPAGELVIDAGKIAKK